MFSRNLELRVNATMRDLINFMGYRLRGSGSANDGDGGSNTGRGGGDGGCAGVHYGQTVRGGGGGGRSTTRSRFGVASHTTTHTCDCRGKDVGGGGAKYPHGGSPEYHVMKGAAARTAGTGRTMSAWGEDSDGDSDGDKKRANTNTDTANDDDTIGGGGGDRTIMSTSARRVMGGNESEGGGRRRSPNTPRAARAIRRAGGGEDEVDDEDEDGDGDERHRPGGVVHPCPRTRPRRLAEIR
jgi:hypothetical protein